jgi:hypothetical protein
MSAGENLNFSVTSIQRHALNINHKKLTLSYMIATVLSSVAVL